MIEHTVGHQYRIRLGVNNKIEIFKYNQLYTSQDTNPVIMAMLLEIDKLKKQISPSSTNIINFPKDVS